MLKNEKELCEYLYNYYSSMSWANKTYKESSIITGSSVANAIVHFYENKTISKNNNVNNYLFYSIKYLNQLININNIINNYHINNMANPNWELLLSQYLFNFLQVGFDLRDKKLYYTKEFLSFIQNKKIESYSENIRLKHLIEATLFYDKLKYANINDYSFKYKKLVHNIYIHKLSDSNNNILTYSEWFSEKEIAKTLNNYLMPFFFCNYKNESLRININQGFSTSYIGELLTDVDSPFPDSHKLITALNQGNNQFQQKLILLQTNNFIPPTTIKNALPTVIRKIKQHDINYKKIQKLSKFLKEHNLTTIMVFLWSSTLSLKEIIAFLTKLNRSPLNFLGFIENCSDELEPLYCKYENHKDLYNHLHELFITLIKEKNKNLTDPIELSLFKYKDKVSELTSTYQLELEGLKMKHCVGGYSRSLIRGSRIFHIEVGENMSTVEYTPDSWKINQHYSKRNSIPNEFNIKIAQELKNYLKFSHLEIRDGYFCFDYTSESLGSMTIKVDMNNKRLGIYNEDKLLYTFFDWSFIKDNIEHSRFHDVFHEIFHKNYIKAS